MCVGLSSYPGSTTSDLMKSTRTGPDVSGTDSNSLKGVESVPQVLWLLFICVLSLSKGHLSEAQALMEGY